MLLLALNDHWWKAAFPGLLTGKLSDAAGMIFFPLFLQALVEGAQALAGRDCAPSLRVLAACVVATAVAFAAIKLSPLAGDVYTHVWGAMQWPIRAAQSLLSDRPLPPLVPVALVQDPTDVAMVPFAAVSLLVTRKEPVHAFA
jgi:hypothetical protein